MKVIIWALWLLVFSVIVLLGDTGFLVTVLLFWLFSYLASACCKDWEKQNILKEAKKLDLTPFEFIMDNIPTYILAECEIHRGNKEELEKYLEAQRKDLNIKKVYQEFILQEYLQEESPIKVVQARVNSDLCGHRIAMKQDNNVTFNNPPYQSVQTQDNIPNKTTRVKKVVVHKSRPNQSNNENLEQPNPCFCRKCGTKLLEDSEFCHKCGTQIILS